MTPREALFRLRRFLRRRDHERSMDIEMQAHVQLEMESRVAAGMSPAEARRTALRDFGGVERYKEQARDERGLRLLDEALRDARYALRLLHQNPAYTAAVLLTLMLGVASTTAVYSVIDGVLVQPPPFAQPKRLAVIWERNVANQADKNVVSVPAFETIRRESRSFTSVAALVPQPVTLGGAEPERIMGAAVSPSYFRLLGARPAIGRGFSDGDEANGGSDVVVLSDGLWRRRFGADSSIVGKTARLDGKPFVVLGVMPEDFDPPVFGWLPRHQLWVPWGATAGNRGWGRFLLVLARLRDGVSFDAARQELAAVAEQRAQDDATLRGWSLNVVALADEITGAVRRPLVMLLGAVALLLLLAAANAGSLMLGFLRRREQEHAVRRALGASTERLFRELLMHGLVVGALACVASLVVAAAGERALVAFMPPDVPRLAAVHLDARVLFVGACIALAVSLECAVVVAWRGTTSTAAAIGRSSGSRMTARSGRGWLVVTEIAVSVVLSVMAGLMLRSFANLRDVRLGFDPTGVAAARISLPNAVYGSADRQRAFFAALGDRLRAAPGVVAAGFITSRPFACCAPATEVHNPAEPTLVAGVVDVRYADSSYFAAMRIPLLAGHGFASLERADGVPSVVVNRKLARSLYRDGGVGKPIHISLGDPVGGDTAVNGVIVGVVEDVHLTDARTPPRASAYLATTRFPSTVRDVVVRSSDEPSGAIAAVRAATRGLDSTLPLSMVASLSGDVRESLARDRFITIILAFFGVASVLLAAVGTYGMFTADVAARRKEIGVRLALGARPILVVALVMRRALAVATTGAMLGVVGGLVVSRSMVAVVFGVATTDAVSFGLVALLLLLVAAVATLIPSIRAARTSPLEAIRVD